MFLFYLFILRLLIVSHSLWSAKKEFHCTGKHVSLLCIWLTNTHLIWFDLSASYECGYVFSLVTHAVAQKTAARYCRELGGWLEQLITTTDKSYRIKCFQYMSTSSLCKGSRATLTVINCWYLVDSHALKLSKKRMGFVVLNDIFNRD